VDSGTWGSFSAIVEGSFVSMVLLTWAPVEDEVEGAMMERR
jgi:hypothetical protein